MVWLRFVGVAVVLMLVAPGRLLAADFDLAVIPYSDDHVPRQAYLRTESPVVRVRLVNHRPQELEGQGRLSLVSGDRVIRTLTFDIRINGNATMYFELPVPLAQCRVAQYRLIARCAIGGIETTAQAPLWVCPQPNNQFPVAAGGWEGLWGTEDQEAAKGLTMSLWWDHPPSDAPAMDAFLQRLHQRGLSGVTVVSPTPLLLDRCLWNQISCTAILQGDAAGAGFVPQFGLLDRLNASGQPSPTTWQPELDDQTVAGLANLQWQADSARNLGAQVALLMKYPALEPHIFTDYNSYQRSGPDYNLANTRRFRQIYGVGAPRPHEMLLPQPPRILAGPTGIIPDNDRWVEWMQFLSRDVLGHYNQLLTNEVNSATDGKGEIGPLSGPQFTPLADMGSAQWPPFNFGAAGFNMICSYNYNFYWAPALTQLWWQELGRMNNRQAQDWLMLDSTDPRATYHLQNWYLAMAAGVDGLSYSNYEHTSDGAAAALARLGPLAQRFGKLFLKLQPAPRNVGLLMPFENACYDIDYPVNAGYAFDNLMMAHLDAEPVWPEELPAMQSGYKAVLLHDVKRLNASNAMRLAEYQRRGGMVIADAGTTVRISGMRRLNFTLADHDRKLSYADPARIAKVRAAIEPLAPPWADSLDPYLLMRHFQAGGIDYLWVVSLMDHTQDLDHQLKSPGAPTPPQLGADADAGIDQQQHYDVLSVPQPHNPWSFLPWSSRPAGYQVVDVLAGKRIQTQVKNWRVLVPVHMGLWQGTLLAFYPVAPDLLQIKAPHHVDAGKSLEIRVTVLAHHKDAAGYLPLEVVVTDPDGEVSQEYSHMALAMRGQYKFHINTALNDKPGLWKIAVQELSTGVSRSVEVRVRPGL